MLPKIKVKIFQNNPNVVALVDNLINVLQTEDIATLYKNAFRNADLRFKDIKEPQIETFAAKLIRDLRTFQNKVKER